MIFRGLFGGKKEHRYSRVPTTQNPLLGLIGIDRKSNAGVDVDEEGALTSTAVWSAVTQLSQDIASLPLHYYKRLDEGKEKYFNSPLYGLLHLQPNPEMTSMAFREAQMGQVLILGTSYAEIERDQQDRIRGLWPLLTARMEAKRMNDTGELYYKYSLPSGKIKYFAAQNILRISGFSHSGLLGYNVINKQIEAIGTSLALQEYTARFFGDNAMPPAVLEHPETLTQEAQDRLRKNWNDLYRGLDNSHRIAILEEGLKLHPFGIEPEKSQLIESRKFQVEEVARIFNMPPHMLKDLSRATFSNIEHQSLEYVIRTLRPWLVRIEQAYDTQLIEPKFQKKYFFEHSIEGLLRGDIKTRYDAYAVAISNGWINADEVRALENLNPQPGGQGKKYYVPLNWVPKDQVAELLEAKTKPQNEPAPEPEPDTKEELKAFFTKSVEYRSVVERDRVTKQYLPIFKQAAQRIVNKEAIAVKKESKKQIEKRGTVQMKDWLRDFYEKQPDYIKEQIGPAIRSFAEAIQAASAGEIGVDVGMTDELEVFVNDYIERYTERHIDSSIGQLIALLEDDPQEIDSRVEEWRETRADKIANNETTRCGNAVFQFAAFGAGLGTIWRIRGPQTCPYCKTLDGRKVRSGQSYVNDGDSVEPAGQKPMKINGIKAHPPLHRGCDCYLSAG